MKLVLSAAALAVASSSFAAPFQVVPEIEMGKVLKVYPQAAVLERSGPAATVGLKLQVGIGDSCHTFAGYWWMQKKSGEGFAPVKKELNVGTAIRRFPTRPCAEVYMMQDVVVPLRLTRGDEASSASDLFNVAGVGSYNVSFDWKTGKATVQSVATVE